jgi:hypothetical protein
MEIPLPDLEFRNLWNLATRRYTKDDLIFNALSYITLSISKQFLWRHLFIPILGSDRRSHYIPLSRWRERVRVRVRVDPWCIPLTFVLSPEGRED